MRKFDVLFVGVPALLAVLVLGLGLPAGSRQYSPWRWYLGLAVIAATLLGWPPLVLYLRRYDLEMVWLLVFFAPLWALGSGVQLLREARRVPLDEFVRVRSDTDPTTGLRGFTVHVGPPREVGGVEAVEPTDRKATGFSRTLRFSFRFGSSPGVANFDATALAKAEELLDRGKDLETVCHRINPDYSRLNASQQQLYRAQLQAALDVRRAERGDS